MHTHSHNYMIPYNRIAMSIFAQTNEFVGLLVGYDYNWSRRNKDGSIDNISIT